MSWIARGAVMSRGGVVESASRHTCRIVGVCPYDSAHAPRPEDVGLEQYTSFEADRFTATAGIGARPQGPELVLDGLADVGVSRRRKAHGRGFGMQAGPGCTRRLPSATSGRWA